MNETGKNIVQQLFGEASLAGVDTTTIEQLVSRYPYFGPAQFLLTKKLKDTNSYKSEEQLQKTALYFSNPYWLNYLLNEDLIAEEEQAIIAENGMEAPAEITKDGAESIIEHPTETIAAETEMEEQAAAEITAIAEIPAEAEDSSAKELIATAAEEDIIITENRTINGPTEPLITEDFIEEEEEYISPAQEDESDPQRLKLSSIIEQHLADFKKPVQAGEELPIKANPYHTVDYFASQGIKADGQDKLTTRVRKFTDWLKQMKAPNAQPTDLGTDVETEQMIETIAQTSNETKDIVTEAMAEVLIKQGKTEKALQLYKKLSFLNPAKSTYFAAKIDELNSK